METLRKWTFMVYMAGDNGKFFDDGQQLMADLQSFGWMNITDMAKVGSTKDVAILTQFDTLDQKQYTPRFFIDQSSPYGRLVDKIPPVNTGDPQNLTEFIVWAERNYPAEKYALVLWNHGTGWKEDDVYARYREKIDKVHSIGEVRSGYHGNKLLKNAFFIPTIGEIMSIEDSETRGICYDDSSMSFLDNRGLATALEKAQASTGQRLTIIGMDACLMSMIEVACQLQPFADVMVGSQEVERAEGWPYQAILQKLIMNPDLTADELGKIIVSEFGNYYLCMSRNSGGRNTQSAINLQTIPEVMRLIMNLTKTIEESFSNNYKVELSLSRARSSVQSFYDSDYVDLLHLAMLVKAEYSEENTELSSEIENLIEYLIPGSDNGLILNNFHGGERANANGISIYLPYRFYSPYYDNQAFSISGWNRIIRLMLKI